MTSKCPLVNLVNSPLKWSKWSAVNPYVIYLTAPRKCMLTNINLYHKYDYNRLTSMPCSGRPSVVMMYRRGTGVTGGNCFRRKNHFPTLRTKRVGRAYSDIKIIITQIRERVCCFKKNFPLLFSKMFSHIPKLNNTS